MINLHFTLKWMAELIQNNFALKKENPQQPFKVDRGFFERE